MHAFPIPAFVMVAGLPPVVAVATRFGAGGGIVRLGGRDDCRGQGDRDRENEGSSHGYPPSLVYSKK